MVNIQRKKEDHLHSKLGPFSAIVIVFELVIRIRPDLIDESEHPAVNGALMDAFKLAVDVGPRGITLETVSHLGSNSKYNK
jgi:hypothetical protein